MIAHQTAADMAYQLVGYIPCDRRVKNIIAGEFRVPISIGTIASIRRDRQRREVNFRRMNDTWRDDGPDPYHNGEYAARVERMEAANDRFVRRLHRAMGW